MTADVPGPDPAGPDRTAVDANDTVDEIDVTDLHGPEPISDADRGATGALLGRVLRVGVIISGVLIVAGLVAEGIRGGLSGGAAGLDHALTRADHPRTPGEILSGILSGDADALITAGLLTLLATPIVRVFVAGFDFRRRGDRIFTFICASVIVLLAVSFVIEYLA